MDGQTLGVHWDPVLTVSLGGGTGALAPPATPGLWDGRTQTRAGSVPVPAGYVPKWDSAPRALAASWFLRKEEEAEKPRKGKM